jgi:hypothetical protein
MTDNMRIWDAVSRTNPDNTKHVAQRGGFTAINANSQIMDATRQFGPLGIGWGYSNAMPIFEAGMIIIPVTLWHGDRANTFGPVFGAEELAPKGRIDTDAPKKAATDGLTKLLSQLGFNADVFLGKYDDQKYVAELRQEFAPPTPVINDAQYAQIITLMQTSGADVRLFLKHYGVATVNELPADMFIKVTAALNKKISLNAKLVEQECEPPNGDDEGNSYSIY